VRGDVLTLEPAIQIPHTTTTLDQADLTFAKKRSAAASSRSRDIALCLFSFSLPYEDRRMHVIST
jgi:hypothetical protein